MAMHTGAPARAAIPAQKKAPVEAFGAVAPAEVLIRALNECCLSRDRESLATTARRLQGSALELRMGELGQMFADLASRSTQADWSELGWLVGGITAHWDVAVQPR